MKRVTPLPKGTLVQVKERWWGNEIIVDSGVLWLVVRVARPAEGGGYIYLCKSLATGREQEIYEGNFDVAPQEQEETSC